MADGALLFRTIEKAPMCVPLEEVAVWAGRKVLMEVDNSIPLIVGDSQGILDQLLRPHPLHFLNIITALINHIILNIINNYSIISKTEGRPAQRC